MTADTLPVGDLAAQGQFFHDAFAHWLEQPRITVARGR